MPSFSLIAITGQSSYPLNSENASPSGTLTVYLSWAEIAAPVARAASSTAPVTLINTLFPFIDAPLHLLVGHPHDLATNVESHPLDFRIAGTPPRRTKTSGGISSCTAHIFRWHLSWARIPAATQCRAL